MSPLGHLFREGPALYTVPAGRAFLRDLARPLLEAYADDPLGLSDVTIYLPNRRATRAAATAFLDVGAGQGQEAILLPRLRALGDVDEEDLLATGTPLSAETSLPPAAEGVERRLVLARFLRRARQAQGAAVPAWPAALAGADELCRLLDDFHTEGVPFSKLETLVTDETVPQGAEHWRRSLEFLRVVTEVWPAWLSQQGRMDGAERRRLLIDALTQTASTAHSGPVIVAGSLGTIPATARFMARVAGLPQGLVLLPGLDVELDDRAWQEIEPPHPQALFKTLLRDHFDDHPREAVPIWPGSTGCAPAERSRRAFLSLILRPAKATDGWYEKLEGFRREDDLPRALAGLRTAVARGEDEEAGFVSLLLREALETPGKTAVLVTPDRTLARRVRAKLALWDVTVDDSGGTPLGGTYRGTFLRAVARWLCDVSDPVALCSVLGHDLCRLGVSGREHARATRALDRALRGARPGPGFAGLRRALNEEGRRVPNERQGAREEALALVDRLEGVAAPFTAATDTADRVQSHVEVAQALCDTDDQQGDERLWRYEDGEALAVHLSTLLRNDAVLPEEGGDYADLFDALIAGPVVRPRGGHPRLQVLGTLEARLLHADRVVLAGLNEGVWPDDAPTDAFLSRPMRQALGLPSPEMVIGRAAHDFSQLAASAEVWLTRSSRQGRNPAKPSRWMVRFESFIAQDEAARRGADDSDRLRACLDALHGHDGTPQPAPPPRPTPPREARFDTLSLSEVGTLMRDPYAIYAKHTLDLPVLDRHARPLDAARKGVFYHAVFERFARGWPDERPADVVKVLTSIADGLFAEWHVGRSIRALWRPQMRIAFEAFAAFDARARAEGRFGAAEVRGSWTFEVAGRPFTLRGRADRIDLAADGRAAIFDYKTGTVPTMKQGKSFSPQIALTAMMLAEGAFEGLEKAEPHRIAYLDSVPTKAPSDVYPDKHGRAGDELAEHLGEVRRGFLSMLEHFADESTPFLSQWKPFMENTYGDYDHLARRGEWAEAEGDDG